MVTRLSVGHLMCKVVLCIVTGLLAVYLDQHTASKLLGPCLIPNPAHNLDTVDILRLFGQTRATFCRTSEKASTFSLRDTFTSSQVSTAAVQSCMLIVVY